ncbi:MAG: 3'-5' exonuclease [Candidatus Tectimicrobiota bacterium]
MFKSVADEVWAFDAEWVPDPVAGRLLYHLPETMPDWDVVQEMWRQQGATAADPRPYLKLLLCRIVSIATVIRRVLPDQSVRVQLVSLPHEVEHAEARDEAALLSRFLTALGQRKPQLVGFNSQAADLKIFLQRGIVHGLSMPEFCRRPAKPWEGVDYFARTNDWHIDLLDVISGWGPSVPSLHQLALLSGIPGKMGLNGDDVAELWRDGELQRILQYNECDALTTYLLWLRMAHFAGFFTTEAYGEEQERVRALLTEKAQSPRSTHLITYYETWERLQGRLPQTTLPGPHT